MLVIKRLIQKIKDGTAAEILRELRWIGSYGRRYLWAIGWYILLGVLGTVIGLAASILSKDIIDIVTGYQVGYAVRAAVFYVAMQVSTICLINRIIGSIVIVAGFIGFLWALLPHFGINI